MGKRLAFLCGTGEFKSEYITNLDSVKNDVNDLEEILLDEDLGYFDDVSKFIGENKNGLDDKLNLFLSEASEDDLVVFYYTGHGLLDKDGRLYFSLPNSEIDDPYPESMSSFRVRELIKNCSANKKVVILDCCHSGGFDKGQAMGTSDIIAVDQSTFEEQSDHYFVLASSSKTQKSFTEGSRAVFTRALIDGLKTGEAGGSNSKIMLIELADYIRKKISNSEFPMTPYVSCLLYTSPSPRDQRGSRMPSSA